MPTRKPVKVEIANRDRFTENAYYCDMVYAAMYDSETQNIEVNCTGKIDSNKLLEILSSVAGTMAQVLVEQKGIPAGVAKLHMEETFNRTMAQVFKEDARPKQSQTLEEQISAYIDSHR